MAVSTSAPDRAASHQADEALRAKQLEQAEELLFTGPEHGGFAKALFRGEFRGRCAVPLSRAARKPTRDGRGRRSPRFASSPTRTSTPRRSIARPIFRARSSTVWPISACWGWPHPPKWGGQGFSQMGYCRIMEVIGGHCASTAVFVNAHHSIGLRALVLFGTPEQQARWLPPLASGEKLAAFALTEEQAGSDASNVQTTARPTR